MNSNLKSNSKNSKNSSNLCYPFIIYLIFIIYSLTLIFQKLSKYPYWKIDTQIVILFSYIIISCGVLYYLCITNYKKLSLLLLPIMIFFIIPLSFTGDWNIFKDWSSEIN